MPAASYREGPDGHSSRKQNSKRRRAKCSPSFVSGRVIGHGDISPRCIPECSAMALHRAVPAARPSRASTLSFVLLAGAFSKSCLRCRFFAGRAAVIWCGANPGVRPWQDLRECVLGRLVVAIFSRGAFPSVYPRQYSATVRSRATIRGKFCAPCIPKVASDGRIASSWQDSRVMHPKRAGFGKMCALCIRKAPQIAVGGYTARRSCQEGPLFAARTPRIMHGAQILPSVVAPNRPSARDPGAAEQCEPPELDRPAQETQPRRQRPRRLLGSKYRQQLPRYRHRSLSTPASSLAPANNSVIADSVTCGDSIHAAPAPPICRAALTQREGYLPYLWRLSSVFLADAIGL